MTESPELSALLDEMGLVCDRECLRDFFIHLEDCPGRLRASAVKVLQRMLDNINGEYTRGFNAGRREASRQPSQYDHPHEPNEWGVCRICAQREASRQPEVLCQDCGHRKNDSHFHFEAPGTNWGAALHHFRQLEVKK